MDQLEYTELVSFLIFYHENIEDPTGQLPPEVHPSAALERGAKTLTPSQMKQGVRAAINDIIEDSFELTSVELSKIDSILNQAQIINISQLRKKYSKKFKKLLERGQIRSEAECYMIKGVLDSTDLVKTDEEYNILAGMLATYLDQK